VIVTRKIALRIALLMIGAVVVQVAFLSALSILGAAPNVVPVVVASLGLLGGALVGAVCGFLLGFLLDSALLQTIGISSLVLLSIGYLAGRYRESFEITSRSLLALLCGGFTLLATAGFGALQLMLGVEAPVGLVVIREVVVQGLLAVLLAFAVYPSIRRLLAPALIDYQPAPSRRVLIPGLRRRRRGRGRAPAGRTPAAPRRAHRRDSHPRPRVGGGVG
jgi:rod shape-determining protein MreD